MPKVRSSLQDVYKLFSPQIDDPKKFVSSNKELIMRPSEDGIAVPIKEDTINEYVDPSTILHQAAVYLDHSGTVGGTGSTPARYRTNLVPLTGAPIVGKIQAYIKGTYSIAPFGLVFTTVDDNCLCTSIQ